VGALEFTIIGSKLNSPIRIPAWRVVWLILADRNHPERTSGGAFIDSPTKQKFGI
jgi:hypothetical protein